jgi:hypothetical protein
MRIPLLTILAVGMFTATAQAGNIVGIEMLTGLFI